MAVVRSSLVQRLIPLLLYPGFELQVLPFPVKVLYPLRWTGILISLPQLQAALMLLSICVKAIPITVTRIPALLPLNF